MGAFFMFKTKQKRSKSNEIQEQEPSGNLQQCGKYAEYQLGKIYLFGKDAEKNFDKAMEYLKSSAEHGNKYAEQLYQNAHSNRNFAAGIGAFRLFHHLARLIQNRIDDEKKGKFSFVDRKLRRMIDEKKQAQGLKLE